MLNQKFVESLIKFEKCIVPYRAFSSAIDGIEECMQLTEFSRETVNCALIAPSGAGKSTICSIMQKKYPDATRIENEFEIIEKPVIWAEVPPNATPKKLASALLLELGDPNPEAGTEFGIIERLITRFQESRTKLVLLDEFHNLLNNNRTTKSKQATCQTLKTLTNKTKTAICLVGTEEFSTSLDKEISRRFTKRLYLNPLSAGTSGEPGEFISFTLPIFRKAKEIFGLETMPDPSNYHFAKQFWAATGGMPAYILVLLKDAISRADTYGEHKLDIDNFAQSWDSGLTREVSAITINPFALSPKELALALGRRRSGK